MKNNNLLISVAAVILTMILVGVLSFVSTVLPSSEQAETSAHSTQVVTLSAEVQTTATETDVVKGSESASKAEAETKAEVEGTGTLLNISPVNQHPELPTGCEVTSLTMLLNYYGLYADKCDIADNYLTKGEVGTVDFRVAFEGDPRDSQSYGCYAPVIVDAANRYLSANGSGYQAVEVSGQELEALFQYIDSKTPVMVWGTLDCREGYYSTVWHVDGRDLQWITPEHCMVLIGYDANSVTVADPFYGEIRTFDKETFRSGYNMLFRQAIVLR